jgi:hypothetical protein
VIDPPAPRPAADDDCTKLDGAGARQLAAVLIEAADEIDRLA